MPTPLVSRASATSAAEPRPAQAVPTTPRAILAWLARAARAIELQRARLLHEHGLTGPQHQLLELLLRHDGEGLQQIELSRVLMVSKPNVTGVVQRLEREGLVSRRTGADARAKLVSLTPDGRAVAERLRAPLERQAAVLLEALDPEQIDNLVDSLAALLAPMPEATSEDDRAA